MSPRPEYRARPVAAPALTRSGARSAAENVVDLGRRRQRRLRAEAGRGEGAGGARPRQRLLFATALEQRDEQACGERVSCRGSVDGVDRRRSGACSLLAVVEEDSALFAQRERDEAVAPHERFELVPVDDRQVGIDGDRPGRCGVEAEEADALLPGGKNRLVGHLELTQDGVVRR